jgi:hypothetical protein
MDRLSNEDQTKLLKSAQKVATYVDEQGLAPTDALYKVASEDKLTPIMVKRAAEAYNKSKSVDHFTKTAAGDDRARPFPLADPAVVIKQIYTPEQKIAATTLPQGDFTTIKVKPTEAIEKAASAVKGIKVSQLPAHSAQNMIDKHASLCERFSEHVDLRLAMSKKAFLDAIDNACDEIKLVPNYEMRKIAQLVTNGYHKDGEKLASKMLAIIAKQTRREFPEVQKTANAAVFPNCQPYIALNQLKEAAFAYNADMKAAPILLKEADFGKDIYESYIRSRQLKGPDAQSTDILLDIVDPEIINNLNKQRARTRLMELMLHDEDFANYDVDSMLKAYRNTVGSVPKAVERPTVLKNLMLKNIESGGRKDLFELGQEAKLEKDISNYGIYGEKELL